MSVIYVRTVPGRVARISPRGRFIPDDAFIGVQVTPYIDRLLNVHGDIELRPAPVAVPSKPTASETKKASAETTE